MAENNKLVTCGIVAASAETGYGYIKRGQKEGVSYIVDQFVEKSNQITGQEYIGSGEYY